MKWVLLLGVAVSLVSCRTIFDYERDGLENKQEGLPGRSVTGQYEWRGPDGKVTEVSYVADHLGFRLLDDLELKPPTKPFRPAESTPQINMKHASDSSYSEQEEEEEDEEEEENETGEGEEGENEEEEEEEQEEEGGEETSVAHEQERTAETEQEEAEASVAETEGAESPKANENEADTAEEDGTKTSESTGKTLDQSDATKKQKTSDDVVVTEIEDTPAVEKRTGAEEDSTNDAPVPVEVDSTSPEESSNVIEAVVIDEFPATSENEQPLIEEAPVIATAEMTLTAEPMVAPIAKDLSAFATKDLGPSEDIAINDAEMSPVGLADSQQMVMTSDSFSSPSAFPGAAIVVIGSFSDEGQNIQNDFEREERTIASMSEAQEQMPESFVNTAVFPIAEPLLQSVVNVESGPMELESSPDAESSQRVGEIESISIDVEVSPFAEPLQQPAGEVELVLANKPMPALVSEASEPQLFLEVSAPSALESAIPVAKMIDVEHQATESVPVFDTAVTQQIDRLIQDSTIQEIPLALPIQQVQMPETDDVRPIGRASNPDQSATVFVRDIELTETDNRPNLEIELDKHRFDLSKPSRSVNNIPALIDSADQSSLRNLYFISETLQVPDLMPGQSTLHLFEVPTQDNMIIEPKMVSQSEEPVNSEFISKSSNEIVKSAAVQSNPVPNSMNVVPIEQIQSDVVFMPSQEMLVQVPVTKEAMVSAPQIQETIPSQTPEQMVLPATREINVVELQSSQTENIAIPVVEIPVDIDTLDQESVILIRTNEPPKVKKVPMQGPPLLPPLMKVPRLLI